MLKVTVFNQNINEEISIIKQQQKEELAKRSAKERVEVIRNEIAHLLPEINPVESTELRKIIVTTFNFKDIQLDIKKKCSINGQNDVEAQLIEWDKKVNEIKEELQLAREEVNAINGQINSIDTIGNSEFKELINKKEKLSGKILRLKQKVRNLNNLVYQLLKAIRASLILQSMYMLEKRYVEDCINVSGALAFINNRLRAALLLEINYSSVEQNKAVSVFDWFVVEAIKFDEELQSGFAQISGWRPLLAYLKDDELELYKDEPEA